MKKLLYLLCFSPLFFMYSCDNYEPEPLSNYVGQIIEGKRIIFNEHYRFYFRMKDGAEIKFISLAVSKGEYDFYKVGDTINGTSSSGSEGNKIDDYKGQVVVSKESKKPTYNTYYYLYVRDLNSSIINKVKVESSAYICFQKGDTIK